MSAAQDLIKNHQHIIESLTLTMGSKGIFDVSVDDKVIYSKDETGRHAHPQEVLELFENAVGDIDPAKEGCC